MSEESDDSSFSHVFSGELGGSSNDALSELSSLS